MKTGAFVLRRTLRRTAERVVDHEDNFMLLLGKSLENLENILNNGFQNSVYWDFEPGLYITDSLDMAIHYSETKYQKKNERDTCRTIVFL